MFGFTLSAAIVILLLAELTTMHLAVGFMAEVFLYKGFLEGFGRCRKYHAGEDFRAGATAGLALGE